MDVWELALSRELLTSIAAAFWGRKLFPTELWSFNVTPEF